MVLRISLVHGALMVALVSAQRLADSGESATELGCFRRSMQNGLVDTCYLLYQSAAEGQSSHQEAAEACKMKLNGQLARIPDTATQTWLETVLNSVNRVNRRQLWIGAKFSGNRWAWHAGDGENVLTFTNWAPGQQNSDTNRCAYLGKSRSSWKWLTTSCETRMDYLCEYANCGRPEVQPIVSSDQRIIGGKMAIPHSWPWMVSIQIDGRGICGGTLIDERWVLTAAHCSADMERYRDRRLAIGFHNLQQPSNTSSYRRIANVIQFPGYNASTLSNDIALLELDSPVKFNHAVKPVCLPPRNQSSIHLRPRRSCYAMGWGYSFETTQCCALWIAKRDTEGLGTTEEVSNADTPFDCQIECFKRDGCVAVNFRYNDQSSSACYLVLSSSPSNSRSGVDYYAINRDPRCAGCKLAWTLYESSKVVGNAIRTTNATSLDECKFDCFSENLCTSFNYMGRKQEGQRCTLLSEPSREDMEPSSDTDHYELNRQFFDDDYEPELKQVELPIYDRTLCRRAYREARNVDETMFCAGRLSGGMDTSKGDSGGPLVCQEEDGRWVQFGITSWGSKICGERGKPAVFTIVSRHRDWIDRTIRSANWSAIVKSTPATVTCPRIISRLGWRARAATSTTRFTQPIRRQFVQHTVTETCTTPAQCANVLRSIQNYHITISGLADISYNFLIGGDGNVYEGRGWNYVGGHTPSWNSQSLGIAFIGNFMTSLPSSRAMNALSDLLACGVLLGKVSNSYSLHGHRDGMCTLSPGNVLYNEIKTWPRYGGKLSTPC